MIRDARLKNNSNQSKIYLDLEQFMKITNKTSKINLNNVFQKLLDLTTSWQITWLIKVLLNFFLILGILIITAIICLLLARLVLIYTLSQIYILLINLLPDFISNLI